jgi:hypothetical protein
MATKEEAIKIGDLHYEGDSEYMRYSVWVKGAHVQLTDPEYDSNFEPEEAIHLGKLLMEAGKTAQRYRSTEHRKTR